MPPQTLTPEQQKYFREQLAGISSRVQSLYRQRGLPAPAITPQGLQPSPSLQVPPTPVSTAIPSARGAMEAGAEQATSAFENYLISQREQAKERVTASEKSLREKAAELLGIPQQQATLEQEADIEGKLQEQKEARAARIANNNLLIQEQRALAKQIEAIRENPTGMSASAMQSEIDRVSRESLSKQADISLMGLTLEARFENATFDLTSAQSLIKHKISLLTEPIKTQLEFQKFFLERNYDLLDKSEKAIMDKLIADNKAKLDKTENDLKTANNYLLKAGEGGAPPSVFQAIQEAINQGRYDEARNLAAPYLVKKERDKKLFTLTSTNRGKLLGAGIPLNKVLAIEEYLATYGFDETLKQSLGDNAGLLQSILSGKDEEENPYGD
jgi:hypothetical protein